MSDEVKFEDNPGVAMSMAITESHSPMLRATTRWDYVARYLVLWKEYVRFRFYFGILLILGIFFLFTQPILAVPALAASAYFYQLKEFRKQRTLRSKRTVIVGH